MPKWKQATLINTRQLSPTTRSLFFEVEKDDAKGFAPGQFITFDLPIAEKRLDRWRSYSIASIPSNTGIIELCVVRFEKGKGSNYLFDLPIGGSANYKGPAGVFTLPNSVENKLLTFICTGTGVAPFKSMIDTLDLMDTMPSVDLIFGCRYPEDRLYATHFNALSQKRENFSYLVAQSRAPYQGYQGYVHAIYEARYQSLENRYFYLCGWQQMIDEAVERLGKMGVNTDRMIYELYG